MTLAAVDRLVHHSTIFEMNVESRISKQCRAPSRWRISEIDAARAAARDPTNPKSGRAPLMACNNDGGGPWERR